MRFVHLREVEVVGRNSPSAVPFTSEVFEAGKSFAGLYVIDNSFCKDLRVFVVDRKFACMVVDVFEVERR